MGKIQSLNWIPNNSQRLGNSEKMFTVPMFNSITAILFRN